MQPHPMEAFFRRHKTHCAEFLKDCYNHPEGTVIGPFPLSYQRAFRFAKSLWGRGLETVVESGDNDFAVILEECPDEHTKPEFLAQFLAETACFIETYDQTRTIYTVTPELWEGLKGAKFPENFPTKHLRIPRPAMCVEVPGYDPGDQPMVLMLHLNAFDDDESRLALRIATPWWPSIEALPKWASMAKEHGPGIYPCPFSFEGLLPLDTESLGDSWRQFEKNMRYTAEALENHADEIAPDLERRRVISRGVLNLLLYMQGEDDVVALVHPGARPSKPPTTNPKKLAKRAIQDLLSPHSHLEIGRKYATIIKRWQEEDPEGYGSESVGGHRSPRPHMRSAHAHLYWTGEARGVPVVKYLPPIPVKGGTTMDDRIVDVR